MGWVKTVACQKSAIAGSSYGAGNERKGYTREVPMTGENVRSASAHVRRNRILGVAGATLAAVAVWAIEVPLLGFRLQTQFGNAAPQSIGIELVALSSLAGSLAGWGLLAILERRFSRARTIWTGFAIAGFPA